MKLKAFSFLEVLVAIVISGIVISTVYSVYVFTHKQYFKFNAAQSKMRNYFEFSTTINRDFEKAKKVIMLNNYEIELQLVEQNINYQFNNEAVIRTVNLNTDTFHFTVNDIEFNLVNELSKEKLIDYLKMNINDNALSFYKNYGAITKLEN